VTDDDDVRFSFLSHNERSIKLRGIFCGCDLLL
jgi:hypothetical protein